MTSGYSLAIPCTTLSSSHVTDTCMRGRDPGAGCSTHHNLPMVRAVLEVLLLLSTSGGHVAPRRRPREVRVHHRHGLQMQYYVQWASMRQHQLHLR